MQMEYLIKSLVCFPSQKNNRVWVQQEGRIQLTPCDNETNQFVVLSAETN